MIDLESDSLTFVQTRQIKQQVERDCQLLRNRVRMLKNEMERARKKIDATNKKTEKIKELKVQNDKKYQEKMRFEAIKREQNKPNRENMERRRKLNEDIKEKKFKVFLDKRKEVDEYKKERQQLRELKMSYQAEREQENYERKMLIRQQLAYGQLKKMEFYEAKRKGAQRDKGSLMETQRQDIYAAEKEAEELEQMEAILLQQLQETQKRETNAFGELKTALIDASVPKRLRASVAGGDAMKSPYDSAKPTTGTSGSRRTKSIGQPLTIQNNFM